MSRPVFKNDDEAITYHEQKIVEYQRQIEANKERLSARNKRVRRLIMMGAEFEKEYDCKNISVDNFKVVITSNDVNEKIISALKKIN
jgi:hypothetical protein